MSIISARIAWQVVHAPKAELVSRMRTLGKDLCGRMVADLCSSTAWIKGMTALLQTAELRLRCVDAVVAPDEPAAAGIS
ncbi:hypothetical protein [Bosea rubneri]|uniref:Transposase n=1 Tax=Bosea rubneri TaxID=3075434 RepID=A0ABU3SCH8_9HYPH|nr:hypothetical protein [Bosea sp. ZW T0_25]MDU0342396.1 hypothetical protein [Bosea sp. ZW T0_25]